MEVERSMGGYECATEFLICCMRRLISGIQKMNGDPCVGALWHSLARVACDRARGACWIIITAVLWALFEMQRVEVEGVWGLTEDGTERGMMGEVACKHVSICCWDGGNLQKEFSPWPSLSIASGCFPRLNEVMKPDTKTHRNRRRGIMAA